MTITTEQWALAYPKTAECIRLVESKYGKRVWYYRNLHVAEESLGLIIRERGSCVAVSVFRCFSNEVRCYYSGKNAIRACEVSEKFDQNPEDEYRKIVADGPYH